MTNSESPTALYPVPVEQASSLLERMILDHAAARSVKDWYEADRIYNMLGENGIHLHLRATNPDRYEVEYGEKRFNRITAYDDFMASVNGKPTAEQLRAYWRANPEG